MRNWLKVGIILMLVVLTIGCGSGKGASPEGTVNSLLDAWEDIDADKMLDYVVPENVTEEMRQEMEEGIETWKEMDASLSITNRDISVVSRTEDSATVSVSFDVKVRAQGETQTERFDETWTLLKRDDKWLLTVLELTGPQE